MRDMQGVPQICMIDEHMDKLRANAMLYSVVLVRRFTTQRVAQTDQWSIDHTVGLPASAVVIRLNIAG